MIIPSVRHDPQNVIGRVEYCLNSRVSILAIGIISSAAVLAIVQPPAALVLATVIIAVSIAAAFPHPISIRHRPTHVREIPELLNSPMDTYTRWRDVPSDALRVLHLPSSLPRFEPTWIRRPEPVQPERVPVGATPAKRPEPVRQNSIPERVPVGRNENKQVQQNSERVPVGVR